MSMPSTLSRVPFNISDYAMRQAAKAISYGLPPAEGKRVGLLEIERLPSGTLPSIPSSHPGLALTPNAMRAKLTAWKPSSVSAYRILRTPAPTDFDRFCYQQATFPPVPDEKLEEYHSMVRPDDQKVGYIVSIIGRRRRKPANIYQSESTTMIRKQLYPSKAELVVDPVTNTIALENPVPGTFYHHSPSPFRAFKTTANMPDIPAVTKYDPTILEAENRWASKTEELERNKRQDDQAKISQSKAAVNKAGREVALAARALYSPETRAKINRRTETVLAKLIKNYPAKKRAKRANRLSASPLV